MNLILSPVTSRMLIPGLAVMTLALSSPLWAANEQRFATPEAAVSALTAAAKDRDTNAWHAILGLRSMNSCRPMQCRRRRSSSCSRTVWPKRSN